MFNVLLYCRPCALFFYFQLFNAHCPFVRAGINVFGLPECGAIWLDVTAAQTQFTRFIFFTLRKPDEMRREISLTN